MTPLTPYSLSHHCSRSTEVFFNISCIHTPLSHTDTHTHTHNTTPATHTEPPSSAKSFIVLLWRGWGPKRDRWICCHCSCGFSFFYTLLLFFLRPIFPANPLNLQLQSSSALISSLCKLTMLIDKETNMGITNIGKDRLRVERHSEKWKKDG